MRAAIMISVLCVSFPALAHDPAGHAKHHDKLYKGLKQPGTSVSCCSDMDCRPVKYRITATGIEMEIAASRWIKPPQSQVIEHHEASEAHWCGVGEGTASPTTYCAIIPRGGV